MGLFSRTWKSSKKPSKQRKYLFQLPLHLRKREMSVHLSKELAKKHGRRNISIRKDDQVIVLRGQNKGTRGKVHSVNNKNYRVFVEGIERTKIDGSKSYYPIHPSNLIIVDLNLDDKRRLKIRENKKEVKNNG